jgi:cytochrome o ubiquinol oxidase subunit 2
MLRRLFERSVLIWAGCALRRGGPRRRLAAVLISAPLAGCSVVLDPRGPVGAAQKLILYDALSIMLAIVVPVILATAAFAWWFRAGNPRAFYLPNWEFSGHLELIVWSIPLLTVVFLGGIAWFGSHDLDPYRPLNSPLKPVEVEAVSLDWKWLFIYPEEGVASVNALAIPVGVPVHFRLTSSGVMNSFFIPQLGSQIYTMAGMVTQLHLQADDPGDYRGISANFSGPAFADMHFVAKALPPADYAQWIGQAKSSGTTLDRNRYAELVKPSADVAPESFGAVEPKLFEAIATGAVPDAPADSYQAPGGIDIAPPAGGDR